MSPCPFRKSGFQLQPNAQCTPLSDVIMLCTDRQSLVFMNKRFIISLRDPTISWSKPIGRGLEPAGRAWEGLGASLEGIEAGWKGLGAGWEGLDGRWEGFRGGRVGRGGALPHMR